MAATATKAFTTALPDDVDTKTAPAKMLNDSGPWDFFISHKQSETGRAVALITRDLEQKGKKVWLDVNMDSCSEAAMMEGVDHSTFFVCVLSDGYFASKFCRSEALQAQAAGKQIILCHAEGMNVGAALQSKPEGFEQIGQSNSIQLIDSNRRLRQVSVQRLLEAAGEETTKAAEERARREREAETTAELEQARAAIKAAQHEVQAEKDKTKAATEKAATEKAATEKAAKEKAANEKAAKAAKVAQVAPASPAPQQMGRNGGGGGSNGFTASQLAGKWQFCGCACCIPLCAVETWVPQGDKQLHASGCGFLFCVYPVIAISQDYYQKGHNKWSHPCVGDINFDNPNHGNACGLCILGEMKRQ